MFKFLKGMFRTEEIVLVSKLGLWLSSKSSPFKQRVDVSIKNSFLQIKNKFEEVDSDLQVLEDAVINDPDKVQDKIRSVVLGHRSNYIRLVRQLVSSVSFPESADYKQALVFCNDFNKHLDLFSKSSVKSYYTSQHLFSKQVQPIADKLKLVSSIAQKLIVEINDSKLLQIDDVFVDLKSLDDFSSKKDRLQQEIVVEQSRLSQVEKQAGDLKFKIQELKGSQASVALNDSIGELEAVQRNVSLVKNSILDLFTPLESAFKKFERIAVSDQGLISFYVSDPINALLEDDDLVILSILDAVRQNLSNLDLRDKKLSKSSDALNRISRGLLSDLKGSLVDLKLHVVRLSQSIKDNDLILKLKDLDYKLEHYQPSIQKHKNNILSLQRDVESIDPNKLLDVIEEKVVNLGFNLQLRRN